MLIKENTSTLCELQSYNEVSPYGLYTHFMSHKSTDSNKD